MKTRFYIFISMALMLLVQTGCIYENDSTASCGSADKDLVILNLNLSVPSTSAGTRTELHDPDRGTDAESYIDILNGDYEICIFDKDDVYVGDKLSEIECKENGYSNGTVNYTLTARFRLTSNEDKERLKEFRVMVLTNWKSFESSNTYPSFADYKLSGTAPYNIFSNGANFNFNLPEPVGGTSWAPAISARAIPMFGISKKLDLEFVMNMANYGDQPVFNVPMLRSLAKVEIVDMVPNGQSANIEQCVLTLYNTSGRFIPDIEVNTTWDDADVQIKTPSLPDGVATAVNLPFVQTTKTVRTEGAAEDETKDSFVVYIPEMALSSDVRPVVNVRLAGSEQIYPIEFSGYEEGKPKAGAEYTALLRNHNYRFDIVNVGTTMFDFLIQTPWEEEEAGDWEYQDLQIKFREGSEFKWDFSNYDADTGLPKFENGTMLNPRTVIITQDDWLEGTFTLISPEEARWTISLYGDDNTLNDHFNVEVGHVEQHDSDEGVYYTKVWTQGGASVSGKVGEDVLFRIIPSAVNNSNDHYVARVVLTCTTFDDRIMEVNLPYYADVNYDVEGSEMPLPTIGNNGYYYVKQYYSGFKDLDDNEHERPGGIDGDSGEDDGQ